MRRIICTVAVLLVAVLLFAGASTSVTASSRTAPSWAASSETTSSGTASSSMLGQDKPVSGKLDAILSACPAPDAAFLTGEWHYGGNGFVFIKDEGDTPSGDIADKNLKLMTVTPDNCVLTFIDGNTCIFRVGDKKFKVSCKLDPKTREFKASVAFFSIKGWLVRNGDHIDLIYTKPNLEMMMYFLCPRKTHKHIRELCSALDCTDGLTLAIEFDRAGN